ncbi:MAG: hypothetical protein HKN85_00310 [Gammaproteobacteria bacterium]|nr:hypothetical protein [Gammaproteobacteria bacterium]
MSSYDNQDLVRDKAVAHGWKTTTQGKRLIVQQTKQLSGDLELVYPHDSSGSVQPA